MLDNTKKMMKISKKNFKECMCFPNYSSEFIENGFSEKKLEVDAIGGPLEIQIFNKNNEDGYLLHYDYQSEVLSAHVLLKI